MKCTIRTSQIKTRGELKRHRQYWTQDTYNIGHKTHTTLDTEQGKQNKNTTHKTMLFKSVKSIGSDRRHKHLRKKYNFCNDDFNIGAT